MNRRAFTLIELLIVIVIILGVSAVAIPAIVWSTSDWQLTASAQRIQSAIALARIAAMRDRQPRGFRLMPSDADPNALDKLVPLETPPRYSEGLATMLSPLYPNGFDPGFPCLVLAQSLLNPDGMLASPTSWAYNVRLGDFLTIGGHQYCVCGPMLNGNADGFVNWGPAGTDATWLPPVVITNPDGTKTTIYPEYLLLTNGADDNQDGYIDNGWDGIDNDGDGIADNPGEWEVETWRGSLLTSVPYSIVRRPVPSRDAITRLSVPVSLADSTLYLNPISGFADMMFGARGDVILQGPYAVPSTIALGNAKSVFMIKTPYGEAKTITLWTQTGKIETD